MYVVFCKKNSHLQKEAPFNTHINCLIIKAAKNFTNFQSGFGLEGALTSHMSMPPVESVR